jgi:CRP/FNR family cyclic AMP-dependent transcriptional regulator
LNHSRAVVGTPTVRLLTVEPDLGRFLTPDERDATGGLLVPVRRIETGELDVGALLRNARAFGAIILEGMLLHRVQVGEQTALRLLGPGDLLSRSGVAPSMLVDSRFTVAAPARVALLGDEILVAARRWPLLYAGLHIRMSEQGERLGTQLAICQMPRVDQRLLALLWLLAESWGHVTPLGVRLPLTLTHDALGGLVGARRSTVTLALGELTKRAAIIRQDDGWLLIERPPEPAPSDRGPTEPVLVNSAVTAWELEEAEPEDDSQTYDSLQETVSRLREQHAYNTERFQERLRVVTRAREQAASSRGRIERERLSRRPAPSS